MRYIETCLIVLFSATLAACGGDGEKSSMRGPGWVRPDLSDVAVYRADSPYSEVLAGCVIAATAAESCDLELLPLLGQDHDPPTVDRVMERVAVSHPWMGERLRELLDLHLPGDLLALMTGVTAIVIDGDVRPAYFDTLTGAIYIDPAYLWLSAAEKETISSKADFRSDFGQELQIRSLARYVLENDYAFSFTPLEGTATRTIEELVHPLARLLYHELAHANDIYPRQNLATLPRDQSVLEAAESLREHRVSARLASLHPLGSELMKGLAQVMFAGAAPTFEQQGYGATLVGDEFAADGANDDYGFLNEREDVAMLFEETMLKLHYGIERDVAYTPVPQGSSPGCDDYRVAWGERGRLGDPLVRERARLVADGLLGTGALDPFFDNLKMPVALAVERGWCENLDPAQATAASTGQVAAVRAFAAGPYDARVQEDLRPPH